MEQWTYWIHLPGVVMDGDAERPWAGGHLCKLDHDAWYELDQTVWQPVDYADCDPVFYRARTQGGRGRFHEPANSVFDTVFRDRARIHRALSLVSEWPLPPDPALSCTYMKSDQDERCHNFVVGAAGRDWILTGHFRLPRQPLDAELLDEAARCLHQMSQLAPAWSDGALEAAMQALVMASFPEVYVGDGGPPRWHLAFLSAVSVLENLLLADDGDAGAASSITARFSRRAAVLLAGSVDEVDEISAMFRPLYRLRSDLVHGRTGLDLSDPAQEQVTLMGLVLFQVVLRNVLALATPFASEGDVIARIARAADDPSMFEALRQSRGEEARP